MRIAKKAVDVCGAEHQVMKFCEEAAECQEAVLKAFYGKDKVSHVAEEIADMEIMLEQMAIIFGCESKVRSWKKQKLLRLRELCGGDIGEGDD